MLRRIRPGGSSSQLDIGPIARKDHGLIAREYREGEHVGMAQVEDRLLVHGRRSTRVLIADDSAQVRRAWCVLGRATWRRVHVDLLLDGRQGPQALAHQRSGVARRRELDRRWPQRAPTDVRRNLSSEGASLQLRPRLRLTPPGSVTPVVAEQRGARQASATWPSTPAGLPRAGSTLSEKECCERRPVAGVLGPGGPECDDR
jgi:hypothetical protein